MQGRDLDLGRLEPLSIISIEEIENVANSFLTGQKEKDKDKEEKNKKDKKKEKEEEEEEEEMRIEENGVKEKGVGDR
ncbi:hypothetical protein M0802_007948 [Mischocyttarus mexicanus]|nr:hypothetical protein M0802_007948 [Mischocyttarus mexicanus]